MKRLAGILLLLSLYGCGGGGGGGEPAPGSGGGVPAPQNRAPVANAGNDQSVTTAQSVTLNGTASSDPDGDTLTYTWSLVTVPTNSSAVLESTSIASPLFTPDIDGIYVAQLIVNDGSLNSPADTVTITASTPNAIPVANAGPDQSVITASQVTLDASVSADADGDLLSYVWSLTSVPPGSTSSLLGAETVAPTFTPDIDGDYIVQLIVNDGTVNSLADTVTISASTPNTAPVANAGPDQSVITASQVSLNASASSDADGDALSYRWSLTSVPTGSASALLGADTLQPTFTPDIDGEYIAQLIVNDGTVDSLADTVRITSSTANAAPVANAGSDQNVAVMTVVTLDGSASTDADADQLGYVWRLVTIPTGSNAALNLTNTASPRFTADVAGDYIVELVVNDGTVDSAPDTVTVIASTANSAPIANAGADQNVSTSSVVTLNGNGSSDVDGDVLTYAWSFASLPAGSSASLSGANEVSTTFTVDLDGVYVVQLIVNDGEVNSVADTITVTANTANSAPVANAGDDQSVGVGDTVFLNGNASSDADNDGLTYLWSFVARPTGSLATFDDPSAVNPSFVADNEGSYVINLVVNDGTESSAADVVTVDAVTPTIRLFQESRLTEGTFNEITFPYNSAVVLNANVTGIPAPTTLTLGTFKLSAEAGDFTIINLTATDGTSQVVPFFDGITDAFVVEAGSEVQFGLVSPLTGGAQVTLTFSFEIQETGDTFRARFTFTSN